MPKSTLDLESIWAEFSSGNTSALAAKLKYGDERELVTAVITQVLDEASKLTGTLRRHFFDLFVFGSLASMLMIFVFVSRQSFPHGKSLQVVAIASGGIPRYHVVTASDVAVRDTPTVDNSLGHAEEVLGHYAVEDVPAGTVIRTKQLSGGTIAAAELNGREALLIPLRSAGLVSSRLPTRVSLYISHKSDKREIFVLVEAYLLSVSATQDFAVVAVTSAEAQTITSSLATSGGYISQRIH